MPNVNCLARNALPGVRLRKSFDIEIRKFMTVYDGGTDDTGAHTHKHSESLCRCNQCQFEGRVKHFRLELEDCGICGMRQPEVLKAIAVMTTTAFGQDRKGL